MTISRAGVLVLGALAVPLLASPAGAKPYPVNACVATKQAGAAEYCRVALRAWAAWEKTQNDAGRDGKLAVARARLAVRWAKAEAKAADESVDCADTTRTPEATAGLVDSAIGAIVAGVNDGLDLGTRDDARCGRKVLQAAARACARFLTAESDHVRALARDPDAIDLNVRQARASGRLAADFGTQRRKGCPTAATSGGLTAQIDALASSVVRSTTESPNVPDTEYVTISPTGSTPYLGRSIAPVCMDGSPYHFFAKRGTVNKLLMYYQGGGACWEQLTCSVPVCDPSVEPTSTDNPQYAPFGFFDLDDPANPFRDWHIVFVSYCSCDVHFGDAAQDYPIHVEHRGYQNSRYAEKWAREHFVNPEQVFVTGSSAGAYGAWFNAPLHHEVWPASDVQVLADAGNGVITRDFLENEFPNWNFEANVPNDIPGVREALRDGTGIVGYTKAVTAYFPDTRWAHYTTAYDGGFGGQTGFYNVMLENDPIAALSWWEASCAFNDQMRLQALDTAAAVPSNYRYYIGTGSRHTMWYADKVYSDTTGGVPVLVDWVNAMLGGTAGWTNVECTDCGLLLPGDPRPAPLQPPFVQVGGNVKIVCDGGASPSGAFVLD